MRANIHIRKTNQARWDGITNKSAWVNAMLEKSPPNSVVEKQKLEVSSAAMETPIKVPEEAKKVIKDLAKVVKPNTKFCTHGFPVGFCKKGCVK